MILRCFFETLVLLLCNACSAKVLPGLTAKEDRHNDATRIRPRCLQVANPNDFNKPLETP